MARILIVDDSGMMRRNLSLILKRAGHTIVAEAANGTQAYVEYDLNKPDLVTMDITMPGMDGLQAVQKIIGSFPDAVIIMVSAIGEKHHIIEAVGYGAKHYILKPFSPEKVIAVVNEVLSKTVAKASGDN
ncbi:MAG TPA: response regulator [Bacillota bacterium]|nr:response regulator [Bacillota bacterium]